MKPIILLFISALVISSNQTSFAQGSFMAIKYEPDSCLQSDITFSVNTNLLIENLIEWNFGDPSSGTNNTSVLGTPTHTFSDTGTYVVNCIVQVNCSGPADPNNPIVVPCFYIDTVYTTIRIFDCDSTDFCRLYVPNAFTPNGDGINESFGLSALCEFESYEMSVFNRWGQTVFQTSSPLKHWDGTSNGVLCGPDLYVYAIRYRLRSQTISQYFGQVILIR